MPIIDPRLNDPNCAADVTEDFNRVLKIVDGKSALPEIEEGDAGKILTVNADEDAAVWAEPDGGLPAIESGDAGKVLTVNADENAAVWASPGGGGGGGGGMLVVTLTDDDETTLSSTYQEIADAGFAVLSESDGAALSALTGYGQEDGTYYVGFKSLGNASASIIYYETDSANGYPVFNSNS